MTTGFQLRAARSLIGLDQSSLAERAKLNINTIRSMEASGANHIAGRAASVHAVQRVLEQAGVEFIPENGGGAGVRLKKAAHIDSGVQPKGPATDAVKAMDKAIGENRKKQR